MSPYIAILVVLVFSAVLLAAMIVASLVIGPRRWSRTKYSSYECGIDPTPQAPGGGRFPVKYYITAMLFIVFDIEIVFLYPWAVSFDKLGLFGMVEMILFVATMFIAYVYVFRRGGLDWD
ncbi:MAG: NADH-quinone oxidoreductase subunit A [Micropruina sp.]|nr:MAG: NADH-quinone oxidoreductase subunit A [Micropruina sp.]